MNWVDIGKRIRKQREFLGYTREELSEKLNVTPKFCADIELGNKGMSVATLCKLSSILGISTDYILFGKVSGDVHSPASSMIENCSPKKRKYLENIIVSFIQATTE